MSASAWTGGYMLQPHEGSGKSIGGEIAAARMHRHMLRHTFVTTMLDAGVDLCDVQIENVPQRALLPLGKSR